MLNHHIQNARVSSSSINFDVCSSQMHQHEQYGKVKYNQAHYKQNKERSSQKEEKKFTKRKNMNIAIICCCRFNFGMKIAAHNAHFQHA